MSSKSNVSSPSQTMWLVLGNESCDLDSAVAAAAYCYLLRKENYLANFILNVKRSEFACKTEVHYWFCRFNMSISDMIFRDELVVTSNKLKLHFPSFCSNSLKEFAEKFNDDNTTTNICLVDHHILSTGDGDLKCFVKEIIDHRPLEDNYYRNIMLTHAIVGSCCTLVVEKILERHPSLFELIGIFLRGPILIDTANCSVSAGRTKPRDIEALNVLEKHIERDVNNMREATYQEILRAKLNISKLSGIQLLGKDAKVIGNVCVSGLPISVLHFFQRDDGISSTLKKMDEGFRLVIIMGMKMVDDTPVRDIAFHSSDNFLIEEMINWFVNENGNHLMLEEWVTHIKTGSNYTRFFDQRNAKASRKQLMPILKSFLEQYDSVIQ